MRTILLSLMAISLFLMSACTPKAVKEEAPAPVIKEEAIPAFSDVGKTMTIVPKEENIRETPGGEVLGKKFRGEEVTIKNRIGNWVEFESFDYESAYIWAPSLGYDFVNIYSPDFYLDEKSGAFKPTAFFRSFFSQQGEVRAEEKDSYDIFFDEVGLGSHQTTVLEVVTETTETVKHGIALTVDRSSGSITQVSVDFARPINGYQNALERCKLAVQPPNESTNARMLWKAGLLTDKLAVTLERKEWESNFFSGVVYTF